MRQMRGHIVANQQGMRTEKTKADINFEEANLKAVNILGIHVA